MSNKTENNLFLISLLGAGIYLLTQRKENVSGIGSLNTMGTIFFGNGDDIENLDDLRKIFYKQSKKLHPDAGGSTSEFQQLQSEYEKLKYRLYTGQKYTKEEVDVETELDAILTQIYYSIMHLPGITIEVVGKWLWIGGLTFPVKTELKEAGLKFASTKKMWYFAGSDYKGKGESLSIDKIRNKYGSTQLKTQGAKFLKGPGDDLVLLLEKMKFLLTRRKKQK